MHTFYEAVGIMISAQVNSRIQEQLIDKYMLLPNLIWDDCISQASKVINIFMCWSYFCYDTIENYLHIFFML